MEIHFLGTGSAYPGVDRDNTSLCFSCRNYHVLVDVSGNPCRKLKQIDVPLQELDAVILTHFHIDHIYGLPSLLWGMWLEGRTKPLLIYCDKRNEEKLNKWLETMEIHEWGVQFSIEIKTFHGERKDEKLIDGEMNISSFPALHSVPTIGVEVQCEGKTVLFSSDSEVNAHIKNYEHIDLLIHEATFAKGTNPNHTSLTEIAESYDLKRIDRVVLVHLSDKEPYEEELNRLDVGNKIKTAKEMMGIQL